MNTPFLIRVRYLKLPAYLGSTFDQKREWLVYAETHKKAIDKLDKHLRSFLINEPKVGDHMIVDMSSVTINIIL